jgi:DHA1 family multidrug resistance protein-like MFS transporter
MGILSAISGIGGMLAAPMFGRLADKITPPKVGRIASAGASFANSMISLSYNFPFLAVMRFGATAFASGLDPVFQVWLAKSTPSRYRGFIFGWAVTARQCGRMVAPLITGLIVEIFDIEGCFVGCALFYLLMILAINVVLRQMHIQSGVKGK